MRNIFRIPPQHVNTRHSTELQKMHQGVAETPHKEEHSGSGRPWRSYSRLLSHCELLTGEPTRMTHFLHHQPKLKRNTSALLQCEPLRIQNHVPNTSPSSSAILAELTRCTTRSVESHCCVYLFVQISTHTAALLGEMSRAFLPLDKQPTIPTSPKVKKRMYTTSHTCIHWKTNTLP